MTGEKKVNMDSRSEDFLTPLMWASMKGHIERMKLLIQSGVERFAKGRTALQLVLASNRMIISCRPGGKIRWRCMQGRPELRTLLTNPPTTYKYEAIVCFGRSIANLEIMKLLHDRRHGRQPCRSFQRLVEPAMVLLDTKESKGSLSLSLSRRDLANAKDDESSRVGGHPF